MTTQKSRPGGGSGAAESVVATPPQDTEKPVAMPLSRPEVLDALPTYILIVKTPTDRLIRRVYLSLHSAVKATERAQARGHAATLELAQYVTRGESR